MKHIPLEKQSKRAQKEHHDKQRGSGPGVSFPVSGLLQASRSSAGNNNVRPRISIYRSMSEIYKKFELVRGEVQGTGVGVAALPLLPFSARKGTGDGTAEVGRNKEGLAVN